MTCADYTCDAGPDGSKLTCSFENTENDMKKCKPGMCVNWVFPDKGLRINICPNGFSEEFKGLVCVSMKNIGRGEVKVDSVKITLGGLTMLAEGGNIAAGKAICRDSLASFDECMAGVKAGVVKWNLELSGLVRKQKSNRETVAKNHPQAETVRKNESGKPEKPWDLDEVLKNLGESPTVGNGKCVKPQKEEKKSKVKMSQSQKTAATGEESKGQAKKKVDKSDRGEALQDVKVKQEVLEMTCWNCSAYADVKKLSQCADCRTARYCGVVCQREDWEKHWQWCQERKELRRRKKQKRRDGGKDKCQPFNTETLAFSLDC